MQKQLALILLLFCVFSGYGQKTKVSGVVYEATSGEPLPFVNLAFKNSKIGTTTNINGEYSLETYYPTDSLTASFVGFLPQTQKVERDKDQVLNFYLAQGNVELKEVVIKADKKAVNPALVILDKVIEHKDINNREKLEAYDYEVYNKMEFDLNNLDEKFTNSKIMKPIDFVFDNVDSTGEKTYLPFFMIETVSDHYYRKNPKAEKEVIKANRISGLQNESISQFMGDMYLNVNIYDNFIIAFRKSFISPISNLAKLSYHYYLTDSAILDNHFCYKIEFIPRRKGELTFEGDFWVADTSYAIKEVNVTISEGANINFVNDIYIQQEYNEIEPEVWMLTKDRLVVDFNVTKKTMGLYGRKTTSYKDFEINNPKPDEFYSGENIQVNTEANERGEDFWSDARHEPLSKQEQQIYSMVDSLQNNRVFNTYIDIINVVANGYWITGPVEIGPYFTFYSFNPIEGNRFAFGGRTSNSFSTRLMLEGYAAYGLRDKKLKYGGDFTYFLTKEPRLILRGKYRFDYEQLGRSQNAWRTDNIAASLLRRNPVRLLNGYEEFDISVEREWMQGFLNRIHLNQKTIFSVTPDLVFDKITEDGGLERQNNLRFTEITLHTRFAYKEKYLSGEFERISVGTKWPTLMLDASFGVPNFLNGDYAYQRLTLTVVDNIRINPIGYSQVVVESGKIWGNVPFTHLELHDGNETFSYDPYAFNLMNFYEFASDQYISLSVTHHFNGVFFNKIPLLRKLKLREVATFKGVTGTLRAENRDVLQFPNSLNELSRPYYEAGVGVENILKVFRLDGIWRLSYLDNPNISKFGIRFSVQLDF